MPNSPGKRNCASHDCTFYRESFACRDFGGGTIVLARICLSGEEFFSIRLDRFTPAREQ
jgi:hypothetical protein